MWGYVVALWIPALCLQWTLVVVAFRWLRTGRPVPRWAARRIKGRRDAYGAIGLAGFLTGVFLVNPVTPWMHWVRSSWVTSRFGIFVAPAVAVPAVLLGVAWLVENRWRPGVEQGPESPGEPRVRSGEG
jgi:hypothetical protein